MPDSATRVDCIAVNSARKFEGAMSLMENSLTDAMTRTWLFSNALPFFGGINFSQHHVSRKESISENIITRTDDAIQL